MSKLNKSLSVLFLSLFLLSCQKEESPTPFPSVVDLDLDEDDILNKEEDIHPNEQDELDDNGEYGLENDPLYPVQEDFVLPTDGDNDDMQINEEGTVVFFHPPQENQNQYLLNEEVDLDNIITPIPVINDTDEQVIEDNLIIEIEEIN